jgi:hypothetical protein
VDEPAELEGVELEDVEDVGEPLHPAASPAITASAEPPVTISLSFTILPPSRIKAIRHVWRRRLTRRRIAPVIIARRAAICPARGHERADAGYRAVQPESVEGAGDGPGTESAQPGCEIILMSVPASGGRSARDHVAL